jgi:hypothetical protein
MTLTRCSMVGFAVLFLTGTAYGSNFSLSVALEDSVFLEGQSVYAILCVKNATPRTVMEPGIRIEHFRARLMRTDTGQELRQAMSHGSLFGQLNGLILRQGEVRCSVLDLARLGSGPPKPNPWQLPWMSLESGSYALVWEVRLRPQGDDAPRTGEVRFTVRPLAENDREFSLIRSFESDLHHHRLALPHYAREKLPEFYGSKFLIRVYLKTGPLLDELDFDEIYDGVIQAGASAERRAALLGLRLSMTDSSGRFTPEWRRRMSRKVESQIERDVLSIVPRRPSTPSR